MVETRRGRGGGSIVTYSPRRPRARAKAPPAETLATWLDSLAFRRIVEPGDVELRLAASSADVRHAVAVRLVGPQRQLGHDRRLTVPATVETA